MPLNLELALIFDLFSGILCISAFIISSLQQYNLYRKYPFQGLRFFAWGFFLPTAPIINVTLILFFRILGLESNLHEILLILYKFSFTLGIAGIGTFAIGLWNLHPREPTQKWSSTLLGIGGLVGLSAGAIFLSLDYIWLDQDSQPAVLSGNLRFGAIYIIYDFLVIASLVTLIGLVTYVGGRYIRDLREIQQLQVDPTKLETRFFPAAYLALVLAFITLLLQRLPFFEEFQLALTFAIPLSIAGLCFSTAFRKFPSLLAITAARLNSLMIVSPEGLTLYSYDFKKREESSGDVSVLLGGMFGALNIRLSETLKSREGLSSIAFGDQLVIIRTNPNFVMYLISTEINPTISDLIQLFENRFEQQYGEFLSQREAGIIDQEIFSSFTLIVEGLIPFAPLSF
ncbi:MAG: hypothetical protein ACFFFG_09780 [Candidatus Thorarchaeota archaeon]